MKRHTFISLFSLLSFFSFAQTHSILKNIGAGSENGIPSDNQATTWKGKSYFISYDPDFFQNRIWSTDGTSANTFEVLSTTYPDIEFLTSVDNYLIFNAWPGDHRGIFRSNGTQAGTVPIMEFPSQRIVFMEELNSSTVVFITENFANDSTYLWATDGTTNGTINLGAFELKTDFLRFSYFGNSIIFTEKSTNFSYFPPVITDGTIQGTMLVTDFINDVIDVDISNVTSAVGTTDFIFVNTPDSNMIFNGTSVENWNLTGDYIHGFKLGQYHVLFSTFYVGLYDSSDGSGLELFVEPSYFSEPISNGEYVFFHNTDGYVYRTNGIPSSIKKISTKTTGTLNYDPYLFATDDVLLYSTNQGNNVELWVVDLATSTDSLFNIVKPYGFQIEPYAFEAGDHIVYARNTTLEGNEYWVYAPLQTGVKDIWNTTQLVISPNPVENELTITLDQEIPIHSRLSIYTAAGQLVRTSPIETQQLHVDLTGFNSGQYFVRIETGSGTRYGGSFVKK
ncbi:MAG TPA: T9SS type A sorting domain-containing protein [Saprospiraceae bacterium]|nr:T9SS type A sorting domain-containing protein [Saprospiraceae bacterium]